MTESADKSGQYETPAEADISELAFVNRWCEALDLAEGDEEEWHEQAEEAQRVYCADEASLVGTAFNLYHANIETIVPALYNSTPVPDIRRRYGDKDPAAKEGADAIERCLIYLIDEYDFDEVIERCVHHFAVAGRGVARIRYEAQEVETQMKGADGKPVSDVGAQFVKCHVVPWASFRRGPGQSWDDVPWVAFKHHMTRSELRKIAPDIADQVRLDMTDADKEDEKTESDIFKKVCVWEIWDKSTREVLFIAPGHKARYIARIPDPLQLRDFFPVPRPMQTNRGDDTLVPLCTYQVQKPLLDELDKISRRIRRLVGQLRPRALGPDDVDMTAWAKAEDGEIVGISNIMQFLDNGGMDKMLAWFPMDPTVKAIQSLYEHRANVKNDLFEVSGLADVMRGQSNAQETLGAQQMKTQWGSLRIQRYQQDVQRFARDLLRLKAEIVAEKFTPENIAAMTGLQLQAPAIQLIKDGKMRDYRIDIETDSTIRGDLTRNMQSMAQFMQGTAQFLQGAPAAIQVGIPPEILMTVYSAFARNFKLGKEVDDVLASMPDVIKQQQAQAQQQPNPEQMKAEADAKKVQMDLEATKAKSQMKIAEGQMGLKMKEAELGLKAQDIQQKQQASAVNHEMTMQQMADKARFDAANAQN